MKRFPLFAASLVLGAFAFFADVSTTFAQCETDCSEACNSWSPCSQSCTEACENWTTCGYYGVCDPDPDDDGWTSNDNCPFTYNPDQANCDGDSAGNACDSENATWSVVSGTLRECHIVGRTHVGYVDVRMQIEWQVTDISSCGSPNKWVKLDLEQHNCYLTTVWDCCVAYYGVNDCFYHLNNNTCHS